MENFIQTKEDSVLISADTPLISNLNMCENIALIKEVREGMLVLDAENLASAILRMLDLESITYRRVDNCSQEEIFLVMFIRAMMSQENSVIIKLPSNILGNLANIKKIIRDVVSINKSKEIFILDYENYKRYYEGCECNIAK